MSYNGSGTFQINTSGQPVVTGTSISSTVFNALTADLATGLSTAITKDGQTTTTARIPFALGINSTLVTDATNTTSGSIITAGGVGIAKALYVGTTANVAGVATLTSNPVLSAGTANGVAYLNGSKVLTTGSALVFDGTNLGLGAPSAWGGSYKALQANRASLSSVGGTVFLGANFYNNGTANTYIATDFASLYGMADGQHRFYTAPSGTAGNAISFTQAMTLNANGVLALQGASTSATGVGITFPATQSASSDANTLDDYEEGTWTPNQGSGLTVVGAFSSSGTYTKIGRQITITGTVAGATSVAISAGGTICTNCPLPAGSGNYAGSIFNAQTGLTGSQVWQQTSTVYNVAAAAAATSHVFTVTYFV